MHTRTCSSGSAQPLSVTWHSYSDVTTTTDFQTYRSYGTRR